MQDITLQTIESRFPELNNLKAQHGQLTAITVEDKIGLFKKPTRQILSMATALASSDPIGYIEKIAENCFVAGDRELLENDEYFLAIMPKVSELVETKTAALLKL